MRQRVTSSDGVMRYMASMVGRGSRRLDMSSTTGEKKKRLWKKVNLSLIAIYCYVNLFYRNKTHLWFPQTWCLSFYSMMKSFSCWACPPPKPEGEQHTVHDLWTAFMLTQQIIFYHYNQVEKDQRNTACCIWMLVANMECCCADLMLEFRMVF